MAASNNLVKAPHTQQHFTEKQLSEFMKCLDPDTGYLHFMTNYFYIQHPTKGKLLFDPFPFQYELLHAYHNYRLSINLIGRQQGKCVINNTSIKIKHKTTGEIYEIPIGEFFEQQRNINKGPN